MAGACSPGALGKKSLHIVLSNVLKLPLIPITSKSIKPFHCESRLNLAGMLSQLEYLGTMSSLHKMVNFILKMTLHMVSFAIFRAFCYILASKVLKIAREIQT